MNDADYELERRLQIFEADPAATVQRNLGGRDVLIALLGVVLTTVLMLWWAY